ncbi:UDP-N-acetylmuramoyl-L-alanine--D-glutamate ligase [Rufibacter glacialis]|uniref:UDP-N-acetylmuramoylalanine--D-glutamate ligase n=1 Tax=Rufibacter glacialis TaxID=1259555 RepID=A0A5M8QBG3_9BACT|nr:UDP-N-acetylmuramoyl-L-alanine--D-glutamate ligase [Rufibacter glacialis]KAA6432294.1 UDP-N-acetylmuramoyl-L-alanine--D-glutamate ligase [Rufibacter glacialis]GGK77501.1 UDP-N-acetylmuramoylalanine--D-glutamate ligase [Rufibacter glacialis]
MQKIAILGAGESGVGAALLAKAKGFDVFVSDRGSIAERYRVQLSQAQIPFEEETHSLEQIYSAQEIIKSPGIPDTAPVIQGAVERNIPVISEIEFAGRYAKGKFICITGTNGKTTTTLLTYHLLKSAGLKVALAGNVGESLAGKVLEGGYDYYVVELSSFQLDNMYAFQAHIAILLNITPDHLDRYGYQMENYAASKFRVAQNMTSEDYFLFNQDDAEIQKYLGAHAVPGTQVPFGLKNTQGAALQFQGHSISASFAGKSVQVATSNSPLIGQHNQYNTMAAVGAALLVGISPAQIEAALGTFQNAGHRLQPVGEIDGVRFINDSKATNVEAVWYALDGIQKPIVWVVGGTDKGNDYSPLLPLVQEKVKAIVCLGVDNSKLFASFSQTGLKMVETQDVQEAVQLAKDFAAAGDVVLLSPACASFDLFKNYEHRGRAFAEAVAALNQPVA